MLRIALITLLIHAFVHAAVLMTPQEAMQANFGESVSVEKQTLLLSRKEAEAVSKAAQSRLSTKIYRLFRAKNGSKAVGFGILVSEKVRTKNAAALYLITPDGTLRAIEIVAFNEPTEFLPSEQWLRQFAGKRHGEPLRVGREVATITGATMSAQSVTRSARVALALFHTLALGKQP